MYPLSEQELENALDRGLKRVIVSPDGCWLWTGAPAAHGYSRVFSGSRTIVLHRLTYECFVGPIGDGLEIDHLCNVRNCVNPDHLEPVTGNENKARAKARRALRPEKKECRNGHSMKDAYVYGDGGKRCRTCIRIRRSA